MKNKFTFKTIEPTGKWKSFNNPEHQIKLNKIWCGTIGLRIIVGICLKDSM